MADKNSNTNFIYYASIKSRKVLISVLVAERFGLADACDAEIIVQHDLKSMLKKILKITMLIDSATLFNDLIGNGNPMEND